MAVRLAPHIRRAVIEHADRARPYECCGFIVGTPSRLMAAVPMVNVDERPTRFRIADEQHIDVRRALRESRPPLAIQGVYHSHPAGPAWPSPTDVAEAMYPGWLYVIAGLWRDRWTLRAFRIRHGRACPVRLR
jgi:proteasome lid subunit RPN8/RPN11